VQDAAGVQVLEAATDLGDDPHRLGDLQGTGLDPVGEGAAVGVREHHERAAVVGLPDVVDADDVQRVDLAQEASLGQEAAPDVVVLDPVVGQDLDRDLGVQLLVPRQPDGRETTGTHPADQGVPADPRWLVHGAIMLDRSCDSFAGASGTAFRGEQNRSRERLTTHGRGTRSVLPGS
jgi:hypothetical protein